MTIVECNSEYFLALFYLVFITTFKQIEQDDMIGKRVTFNDAESPYIVKQYITSGSFGKIYLGLHEFTGQRVAIKMERQDSPNRQLYLEFGFYMKLGKNAYTPEIFTLGRCGNFYALVMAMLGPSLNDLFNKCKHDSRGFRQRCVAALGYKLTQIFEYVHKKGLIYRDVKPQNFLVGPSESEYAYNVYMIGKCLQCSIGEQ